MSSWQDSEKQEYGNQFVYTQQQQDYQEDLSFKDQDKQDSLLGLHFDPIQRNQQDEYNTEMDFSNHQLSLDIIKKEEKKISKKADQHKTVKNNIFEPKIYKAFFSLIAQEANQIRKEAKESYYQVGNAFIELFFKEFIYLQQTALNPTQVPMCLYRGYCLSCFLIRQLHHKNGLTFDNQRIAYLARRLLINMGIKHYKRKTFVYEKQIKQLIFGSALFNQNKYQLLQIQKNNTNSKQTQTQNQQNFQKNLLNKQFQSTQNTTVSNLDNKGKKQKSQIQIKNIEETYSQSIFEQPSHNYYTDAKKYQLGPYSKQNEEKYLRHRTQQQIIYQKWIQYIKSQQNKQDNMSFQDYQTNFEKIIFQSSLSKQNQRNTKQFEFSSFLGYQPSSVNSIQSKNYKIKQFTSNSGQSLFGDQISKISIITYNKFSQRRQSEQHKAEVDKYLSEIRSFKAEINMLSQQMEIPYVIYNRKRQQWGYFIRAQLRFHCKYLNNSEVVFEAQDRHMNSDKAKAICAQKIIRQLYVKIPELWKDYKRKKQSKGIVL